MGVKNILKPDSRGRIVLPLRFKKEELFEWREEEDCLILYSVQTVRKFPRMEGLPLTKLNQKWEKEEYEINNDAHPGIIAESPKSALKKLKHED
ncbi:MAG: hypothetical protein AB1595_01900 [bacterium]